MSPASGRIQASMSRFTSSNPSNDTVAQPQAVSGSSAPSSEKPKKAAASNVILTGNPNCGKTTVFNALTGLRARVGNYAGVTVERKEGKLIGAPSGHPVIILDLPGTYSLSPQSMDEQISRDVLLNRLPELPPPALVVIVVDGSNLQRNLYYATQVIELGYPTILALNMMDVAETNGQQIHPEVLSRALGVPVQPLIASSGEGIAELRNRIVESLQQRNEPPHQLFCDLPLELERAADAVAGTLIQTLNQKPAQARAEALLLLGNEKIVSGGEKQQPLQVTESVERARKNLDASGIDWRSAIIEGRYSRIAAIQQQSTTELAPASETVSDRIDRVVTHKIWGTAIFLGLMALMFQCIFSFAHIPMDLLQTAVDWLGNAAGGLVPPGDLHSLLVNGVIAGVGAVVVFLPQILLLFLFIGFLEDTGYMARAAFLMDRLMSKVGLHGKSFIPMLSSFACAIPGIMATRTIESPKDRLVTILISPLMSCSARLPVYTILIAACIPDIRVLGFLKLPGVTLFAMYLLGVSMALLMAWIFKKTILKGEPPLLIMELPPYKRPLLKVVMRHMWDRVKVFLRQAGTVILGLNIVLWFLAAYPQGSLDRDYAARKAAVRAEAQAANDSSKAEEAIAKLEIEKSSEQLRQSFAGRLGHLVEPAIAPLGFDWKMGVGLVSSFAAREAFVSTMAIVYNVADDGNEADGHNNLVEALRAQKRSDGTPVYTTLTALTLMVFYVFALQCVSTVAIVRRETNTWKWPLFQWAYMGVLAWVFAFATYRIGLLLAGG